MNLSILFTLVASFLSGLYVVGTLFGRHHSIARWAFALSMLGLSMESLFLGLSLQADSPIDIGYLLQKRLIAMSFLPGLWILFATTYTRGNQLEAVKKRALTISLGLLLPPLLALILRGNILYVGPLAQNNQYSIELGLIGYLLHICVLLGAIVSLMGLERTYRTSIGMQRWKIKFMLFGLGVLFIARFYTSSQALLFHSMDPNLDTLNSIALIISTILITRSIFRPGSFEIDIYPSGTIIGNSLTIVIAGGYLIVVGVFSKLVDSFGGESAFALKTFLILISLVALGILIQSDRFKQGLKSFVSRHFKRPFFDYQSAWMKISEASTQNVDKRSICEAVTREIIEILEVKLCNIWLANKNHTRFTLFTSTESPTPDHTFETNELPSRFAENKDLIQIDKLQEDWLNPIKKLNPSAFTKGGKRIVVALRHQSKLLGFIVLGDRTNGLPFTQQALEIVESIALHIASSLHSAELSQKLADSKELEAFQTIATFFVHDLKNAASTLNLMVKNLPIHWDNPDFRKDAIRGIEKTNLRINKLIQNLTSVRSELDITPSQQSINALIDTTINTWKYPENISFKRLPSQDITVNVDTDKTQSVLLNLLINATEAMPQGGEISLETRFLNDRFHIYVNDQGTGMSPEFINESLFKPFCTTKQNGIGIGMFQSKTIIEAHGGQIEVESTKGQGTRFTLNLPINNFQAIG